MIITDDAKQLLENFLSKKKAEGIRISSVSGGACGSQFTISLVPPAESDKIETINGIRVAFDSEVTGTDELTIDIEEGKKGAKLVLITASNCC